MINTLKVVTLGLALSQSVVAQTPLLDLTANSHWKTPADTNPVIDEVGLVQSSAGTPAHYLSPSLLASSMIGLINWAINLSWK